MIHNQRNSATFRSWLSMNKRCNNPKEPGYIWYGARGIKVCPQWQHPHGFDAFLAHIGERPTGTTLDRINNDGNYEPGNVRWATVRQQNRNRRTAHKLEAFGETRSITEWSEISGLSQGVITYRLQRGWSADDAVSVPVCQPGQPHKGRGPQCNGCGRFMCIADIEQYASRCAECA